MGASAPAKVNLYLRVTGRRADGYHTLDSLVVFAGAADRVAAFTPEAPPPRPSPATAGEGAEALPRSCGGGLGGGNHRPDPLTLHLTGPESHALAAEPDNLVLRAARALAAATGHPACAALTLEKHLPVASGIGGGSADAAATLRALNTLWATALDPDALRAIAATLGADVPICIESRPMRMSGIGDILHEPPALPAFGLLLANPRIALPTPAVFAARAGAFSLPAAMPRHLPDAAALAAWLRPLGNDLEAPAIALCPPIAEVLAAIAAQPGCLLARMSGSGASGFGIFATGPEAEAAAAALPGAWWRWGGSTR